MTLTSSTNQTRLLPLAVVYTRVFFVGVTGLTLTVTISKAGGAFGAVAGTVAEISSGWYKVSLTSGDTDTEGDLAFHATDGGSNIVDWSDEVAAPVKLADKVAHGGIPNSSTATISFSRMVGTSQTADTAAFSMTGNGAGAGGLFQGGVADGIGLAVNGGGTFGDAVYLSSVGGAALDLGSGFVALNISGGTAISLSSNAGGDAIAINAGNRCLVMTSGGTARAVEIYAGGGSNADAVYLQADGTGYDLHLANNGVTITTSGGDAVTVNGVTSVDSIGRHRLLSGITKDQALAGFEFIMLDTSNLPKTGLTVAATRSIDGGSYVSCTNSVSEVGSGRYKINLSTSDLNGGVIGLRLIATGANDLNLTLITTP